MPRPPAMMVGAAVVLVHVVETLPPLLLRECCWKYCCACDDGFVSAVAADVGGNGRAAEVLKRVEAVEEESRSRARRAALVVGESWSWRI